MKDANMNLPNQIYEDWIKETNTLKIKSYTPAAQVVVELTRALKRIVNKYEEKEKYSEGDLKLAFPTDSPFKNVIIMPNHDTSDEK